MAVDAAGFHIVFTSRVAIQSKRGGDRKRAGVGRKITAAGGKIKAPAIRKNPARLSVARTKNSCRYATRLSRRSRRNPADAARAGAAKRPGFARYHPEIHYARSSIQGRNPPRIHAWFY